MLLNINLTDGALSQSPMVGHFKGCRDRCFSGIWPQLLSIFVLVSVLERASIVPRFDAKPYEGVNTGQGYSLRPWFFVAFNRWYTIFPHCYATELAFQAPHPTKEKAILAEKVPSWSTWMRCFRWSKGENHSSICFGKAHKNGIAYLCIFSSNALCQKISDKGFHSLCYTSTFNTDKIEPAKISLILSPNS